MQAGVIGYELTPDGRKMLYSTGGGNWFIARPRRRREPAAGRRGPARLADRSGTGAGRRRGGEGKLNLDAIEVRVEPRAEWQQIFDEAWRINRDYFYDPDMHGADWPAMKKKYEAFLPHLTSGGDLYRVIRWMLSELAVGHSYYTPGERLHERKTVPGGLLGADYEIADGRYRFKKVYGGLNWTPGAALAADRPGRGREGGRVPARRPRQRPEAADRSCTRCSRTRPARASRSPSARTPTARAAAP